MGLYDTKHKSLVEKLKIARTEANISQEELAKKLSKTQSFVSKLENGQVKVDAILLKELADIYKKGVEFFLK
jgi:transcriptional regulator with XRE-family HTH domain